MHTAHMDVKPADRTRRPWTIWLPGALAFLWSLFLIFTDVILSLLSNLTDSAPPPQGWVNPAIIGHCVLAGVSVLALVIGLRVPSQRRAAAITAWLVIPAGLGWLVLCMRLLGGS